MTFHSSKSVFPLFNLLFLVSILALPGSMATAQQSDSQAQHAQSARKAKVNPAPEYPELARKLNIQGLARVLAKVAPDGAVVAVKELGGNPVLVSALAEAVRKWKYEPAEHESELEIKFDFVLNH